MTFRFLGLSRMNLVSHPYILTWHLTCIGYIKDRKENVTTTETIENVFSLDKQQRTYLCQGIDCVEIFIRIIIIGRISIYE